MPDASSEALTFTSGDDRLVGVLYLPAEAPTAAVVTTGPLTSVKEQATGAYARALAARGFAALAFDHRTFGESEGDPRQFEDPEGKARDISAAAPVDGIPAGNHALGSRLRARRPTALRRVGRLDRPEHRPPSRTLPPHR